MEELKHRFKKPGFGVTCPRLVGIFLLLLLFLLLSTGAVAEGIRLIDYFLDSSK